MSIRCSNTSVNTILQLDRTRAQRLADFVRLGDQAKRSRALSKRIAKLFFASRSLFSKSVEQLMLLLIQQHRRWIDFAFLQLCEVDFASS